MDANTNQTEPLFPSLAKAFQGELDQLKKTRSEVILFGGESVGSFAGYFYYRFEIPEDLFLRGVERSTFVLGSAEPVSFDGRLVSHENQYLTIALPVDCGPLLPEVKCSWNHEDHVKPVLDILTASDIAASLAGLLFQPDPANNAVFKPVQPLSQKDHSDERTDALQKILSNRVTLLWGPVQSGKRRILSLAAASWMNAGKKVLYLSSSNEFVDDALVKTAEVCKQLGIDSTMIARVGLPLNQHADALGPISFEQAVDAAKAEKRKTFQERASLLDLYWRIKVKHALHESYTRTIADAREKLTSVKKQLDQVSREIAAAKEIIQKIEKASMMDRLKKGFNKDDLAAGQKQLAEKQQVQKRLTTVQQSLSNEILRLESSGPISYEDGKNFREATKRIEELGGIQKVTETVSDFIKVDEAAILKSKSFIGTTAAGALSHPILKSMKFDFVIVDDAEAIMLPLLAAVATFAKDSIVVSGDPFQLALEPLSNTDLALQFLHRDIFLYTARSEDLHRLFEWAEKNPQWSVLLSSQFATTPKLTSFVSAVLFDDKVKVQTAPQTKGKVYFIDTSDLRSQCRQYVGKKKILPSNDQQTKKALECVKHALMEPNRHASDVGVIVPFSGPTFFTRLQLRVNSMSNIEVGLPGTFRGRRKKAIIFDTSVAGMDFSMRPMDDRKVGDNRIARLWNTVFSCAAEDIYILADMSLFKTLYKDRLFARILMLLQAQSDGLPPLATAVKKFDDLEWDKRASLFSVARKGASAAATSPAQAKPQRVDHDMEMRMKMMAKQQAGTKPQAAERNFEREIYTAVNRVRGFWTDVNLLSQYLGGDLLFRRSITAEQYAQSLPVQQCQSEKDFRAIMEKWNLLIYDLSGGVKTDLVFFSKGSQEARIRHDIRSLKAFYSSDMEATIEEGKHKIAMEVSKVFQEMLGKSQPGNPVEWSTAYVNFLSKLELYLSWISAQLRK